MPVDVHGELEYRIPHSCRWHKCEVVHTLHNTVCLKIKNPPGFRGLDHLKIETLPLDTANYRNRPKEKKVAYGPVLFFSSGGGDIPYISASIDPVYDSEAIAKSNHPQDTIAKIEWEQ